MISIIDYGMGNLESVTRALRRLGIKNRIIDDPRQLQESEALILPGVGSFPAAMNNLQQAGFIDPLKDYLARGAPLLGICLGFQLLFTAGEEGGKEPTSGLGFFPGTVVSLPSEPGLKIPHMGWNRVYPLFSDPLFAGLQEGFYQYFVHSYCVLDRGQEGIIARTGYGVDFVAAIGRGMVYGLQFHPEKGGQEGLLILKNFAQLAAGEGF